MATDVQTDPLLESAPAPPAATPAPPTGLRPSPRIMLLAGLSVAAGVIHAKAMFDHVTHWWAFGVFFGVLTYVQVLWGVQLYRRPDEWKLWRPVAYLSLATIGVWIVSRTVGLPVGPWAGRAEPFGVADISASLDELALAGIIFAMLAPERRFARGLAWLDGANCARVGSMLCSLSLMALLLGSHSHAN